MDAGRLEPEIGSTSLSEIIEGLRVEFAPIAARKGLELRFVPSSGWVRTDRRLLRRVMQNLIGNALKYTRSGRVLVGVRRIGGALRLVVADTGPGIPATKHELIFKEFQRLDDTAGEARGLGLGLSIVERIGRVLGCPIGLRSEPGRGSMFWIDVPEAAAEIKPAAQTAQPRAAFGDLSGCTVLCIDNEPAVLAGMRTLLTGWGCNVQLAATIPAAKAAVMGGKIVPDVILADYHLDDGTGFDAIVAVRREAGADLPAIVITADQSPEVQRLLRDEEIVVLRKPLRAAALRSLLMRYAGVRKQAAE